MCNDVSMPASPLDVSLKATEVEEKIRSLYVGRMLEFDDDHAKYAKLVYDFYTVNTIIGANPDTKLVYNTTPGTSRTLHAID